ncbi:MAG: Hsp70 family protein [Ruminococcus sp.]|nr:Hsp70 family protein [Ruminococcus sp.]
MERCIGIDFGMQNLKVCYSDGRKNYKVDLEGKQQSDLKLSPNVVYYYENEDGDLSKAFFASQIAESARYSSDPDYIRYIKRTLQQEKWSTTVCGGKYTFSTEDVITDIFRQIAFKMEEYRYDMTAPTILTVPVVFSEMQKARLRYCAEQAGFSVQEVLTEPFAAIFSDEIRDECIDVDDDEEEKYVLVFDFGASTLDLCLLGISEDTVRSLASSGINFGGKDISDMIVQDLKPKLDGTISEIIESGRMDNDAVGFELFKFAESLKNRLYEESETPEVEDMFFGEKIVLKQVNINKMLEKCGIWEKIEALTEEMLESVDEGVEADDITQIVMVGGSSRIEWLREKTEDYFENAELVGDPEEDDFIYNSVALGAVNYVNEDMEVQNSLPMSIGVDLGKGFEIALNRNTFYSAKGKRKQISTDYLEKSDWKIKIYQTLNNTQRAGITDDGVLYAGFFELNSVLYNGESLYIRLSQTKDGLIMETMQMKDNEYEIIEPCLKLKTEV